LKFRGDKFRDDRKALFRLLKSKIVTCFSDPNLLIMSTTSFLNFARDSPVDGTKNIFRPIIVIDFFGTN